MTKDNRIPDLWWSPTIGVWRRTPRGPMLTPGFEMVNDPDGEHFRETLPDDAVQLVPDRSITDLEQELYNRAVAAENALARFKAPEPQVFFPGDTVPAGVSLVTKHGDLLLARATPYRITGGPAAAYIEVPLPSLAERATIVDRAHAEREES